MRGNEQYTGLSQAEVELCDYRRLPDSPSPIDLIQGESITSEIIPDLDRFFERLYSYYCDKGVWCIITHWIVELLSLGFTICFSGFFLLYVNWQGLRTAKCGIAAAEAGVKPCNLAKEALYEHPLKPMTLYRFMVVAYLAICSLYWIFYFTRFFTQLRETLEIRDFYHRSLGVTEREIQQTSWPILLDKIVRLQQKQRLCVVRELSAHDIVMRIMRKENYMIGMVNKGIFALSVPPWLPGVGPVVHQGPGGADRYLLLTKTLEWSLNWCILQNMFDRNFQIQRDFISNPNLLRKRLRSLGFCMFILSPFLVIFMLVYFFLRHAEQFYNNPSSAVSRRWSNLASWTFREFNELDHIFKQRLNASYKPAVEYVKQFPSHIISMIAKLISFIAGGLAAVLIIIAFMDESLLEAHLFGRNLLWLAAVFGTITAISRSVITDEFQVLDPQGAMKLVSHQTHYMPKHWRGVENTDRVRSEFEALFQYTGVMLLEEMVSIFVTPFVLFFLLPQCIEDVQQFVQDFTVNVEGVGDVCSLSMFDFEHHGNNKYGSPFHTNKDRRSTQGKMEKSFLSFKSYYPYWEPDAKGQQFLSLLTEFRLQHQNAVSLVGQQPQSALCSLCGSVRPQFPRTSEANADSCVRETVGRTRVHPIEGGAQSIDSNRVRITDAKIGAAHAEQVDQLYWLDQFYSQSMQNVPHESSGRITSDDNVLDSRIEASFLSRAAMEEALHDGGTINLSMDDNNRWWTRRGPESAVNGESFFEPPQFGGHNMGELHDEDIDIEDHDADWLTERQSRSAYTSRLVEDDSTKFDPPFGDIYEAPTNASAGLRTL